MVAFVELRDEDYMLVGSRVSLASLVVQWREGKSPESISQDFPTLSLEQVYGAIAYYLANQTQVDSYLEELNADFEKRAGEARDDRKTMPKAFYAFIHVDSSPGLILIKQGCPVGQAIEELRICDRVLEPPEFVKTIRYIPL